MPDIVRPEAVNETARTVVAVNEDALAIPLGVTVQQDSASALKVVIGDILLRCLRKRAGSPMDGAIDISFCPSRCRWRFAVHGDHRFSGISVKGKMRSLRVIDVAVGHVGIIPTVREVNAGRRRQGSTPPGSEANELLVAGAAVNLPTLVIGLDSAPPEQIVGPAAKGRRFGVVYCSVGQDFVVVLSNMATAIAIWRVLLVQVA
jgi:hypothetical protein